MKVHIERYFAAAAYRVYLYDRMSDGSTYLVDRDGVRRAVPAGARLNDDARAWMLLPEDAAHALLGELGRTLGAVEHPEQLRRDFEHERQRVDGLTDHLMAIQRQLVERIPLLGRGAP